MVPRKSIFMRGQNRDRPPQSPLFTPCRKRYHADLWPTKTAFSDFVHRVRAHEKELAAHGEKPGGEEARKAAIRLAIQDCKNADLLREFWENMSQEELNMLANEWDMETALEVSREEGFESGVGVGMERGMEKGVETVAVNALAKGLPFDLIHELTGLDTETITGLSQRAR